MLNHYLIIILTFFGLNFSHSQELDYDTLRKKILEFDHSIGGYQGEKPLVLETENYFFKQKNVHIYFDSNINLETQGETLRKLKAALSNLKQLDSSFKFISEEFERGAGNNPTLNHPIIWTFSITNRMTVKPNPNSSRKQSTYSRLGFNSSSNVIVLDKGNNEVYLPSITQNFIIPEDFDISTDQLTQLLIASQSSAFFNATSVFKYGDINTSDFISSIKSIGSYFNKVFPYSEYIYNSGFNYAGSHVKIFDKDILPNAEFDTYSLEFPFDITWEEFLANQQIMYFTNFTKEFYKNLADSKNNYCVYGFDRAEFINFQKMLVENFESQIFKGYKRQFKFDGLFNSRIKKIPFYKRPEELKSDFVTCDF